MRGEKLNKHAMVLVVAAVALSSATCSTVYASGLSLGFRTGYGFDRHSFSDMPEGTSATLIGAFPASKALGLIGSFTYFPTSERAWLGICFDHGWCGRDTEDEDILSFSVGLRYKPRSEDSRRMLPYFEVAPVLYYGRWVHRDRDYVSRVIETFEEEHLFAGFQASMVVPVRVTKRAHAEIGINYQHSQDVETESVFGGRLEGFSHLQVFGGLSFRL